MSDSWAFTLELLYNGEILANQLFSSEQGYELHWKWEAPKKASG